MENNWKEDFKKLCKHEYIDCVSHSEGQDCCLDSQHFRNKLIVDFIESLLEEQKHDYEILVNTILEGHKKELAEQKKELLDLVEKEVEKEKNKKYKCEIHNKPMGLTANYYDCTDIHIGRAEALSDISTIINNLRPIKEIEEKV